MTDELVVFLNQQWYNLNIGTILAVRFLAIFRTAEYWIYPDKTVQPISYTFTT
jgi:hypothetical protein